MAKGTNTFKDVIKAHLDKRAKEDELFAASYAKPTKNIDDCISYILSTVQKSGCNGFADDEIYSMAIHYYDEDNIKARKSINCRVVVNHTVELTNEEKEQARINAIKKYQDDIISGLTKRMVKKKKIEANVEQLSLF